MARVWNGSNTRVTPTNYVHYVRLVTEQSQALPSLHNIRIISGIGNLEGKKEKIFCYTIKS